MAKHTSSAQVLQTNSIRIARAHFVYVAAFAALIVVSDAWNLITPQVVLQRWTAAAALLVVVAGVWYLARDGARSVRYYRALVWVLIVADIALATYLVYTQRGLASRAALLYVIPIVVAAVLGRVAIFATAALTVAAYTLAGIRYFVVHPGESYKVELYAELGFYSAVLLLLAVLLWTAVRRNR